VLYRDSTLAPEGLGGQTHAPPTLHSGVKKHGTRCTEGWAGFAARQDGYGKYRVHWSSKPGPPSYGKSLYRLRYSGGSKFEVDQ